MLTRERLRELLHYDPDTGAWTRIKSEGRPDLVGTQCTSIDGGGYIHIRVDGNRYKAARLAFLYMTGAWPTHEVDHCDLDKTNNRWDNLRHATRRENQGNVKVRDDNVAQYKGVTFLRRANRWQARIRIDGQRIFLGEFDSAAAAHAAYVTAAKKHFGAFMRA